MRGHDLLRKIVFLSLAAVVVALVVACAHVLRSTAIPIYIQDSIGYKRSALIPLLHIAEGHRDVNYTVNTLIEPLNICQEDIYLITVILTFAPHARARNTIRETWASTTEYRGRRLRRLFVFGYHDDAHFNEQAQTEARKHNDVLQVDVREGYRSLTNKTVATLLWLRERCSRGRLTYVLKTDDDSFNVPEAYVDHLSQLNTTLPVIGGYCFTVLPDRRLASKYYTSTLAYPSDSYYPTYCAGPAYIVSMSAIPGLLEQAKRARYLSMEDVFITGICRELAEYKYVQIKGAVVGRDEFTGCNMRRGVAKSLHRVVPESAAALWKLYQSELSPCLSHDTKMIATVVTFFMIWLAILYDIFIRKV